MTLNETMETMIDNGYQVKNSFGVTIKNLNTPVKEFSFSTRTTNVLGRNGVKTVGELVDFLNLLPTKPIKGFGVNSVKEVKNALIKWNFDNLNPEGKARCLQEIFA